jgi:hypothetical protein
MTLPLEIARLARIGHLLSAEVGEVAETGAMILDWIDADCPSPAPDFFGFLKKQGVSWDRAVRVGRRDELLREAAERHFGELSLENRATSMARAYNTYRRRRWPSERARDVCPHEDHESLNALLWRALKKWECGPMKRVRMRSILGAT